jgi:hypothetical protein
MPHRHLRESRRECTRLRAHVSVTGRCEAELRLTRNDPSARNGIAIFFGLAYGVEIDQVMEQPR